MKGNSEPLPEPTVTLADCADEPIHRPGAIQPHGVLLVFDFLPKLVARSENAEALIGDLGLPALGEMLGPEHLGGEGREVLLGLDYEAGRGTSFEMNGAKGCFDVVVHVAKEKNLVYVEFEQRKPERESQSAVGYLVHSIASRLQRHDRLEPLLEDAVIALRELTRFDRVMAYRFLPDDCGEVVAESRRADLEPFLGMRYPASDIPAQARRLYVLNRVRTIPDISYQPVAMVAAGAGDTSPTQLDMSHCMLRSVSPIHVEYLQNMGVRASMSISLVLDGKLWGLIACHHMGPIYPGLNVRLSCLTLSEHLSLLVGRVADAARQRLLRDSAVARTRLVERAASSDDLIEGLVRGTPTLLDVVRADGVAITLGGRIATLGSVPPRDDIRALVERLAEEHAPVFVAEDATEWRVDGEDESWAGVLAIEFHKEFGGYVIWFRQEQLRHVRWGGNPEKHYGIGANGARLTPRGSFEEWRQLARGTCAPWLPGERDAAADLRAQLQRDALQRVSKLERMQTLLIGVLGHDLRTPLHAISLSAQLLSASSEVGATIRRSTTRMTAMIDSMLDYARLANNEGLSITRERQDLHACAQSIVDETLAAYPGCVVEFRSDGDCMADIDTTRMGQLLSNLLSNARHHGDPSRPISVAVTGDQRIVRIEVANFGPPIPPERQHGIFEAFASIGPKRSRDRVGLGLFISRAIAQGHGGAIDFTCEDGVTTFRVTLTRFVKIDGDTERR